MIAVRWRNSETEQPPSLYASTTAGVVLNRKHPGDSNEGPDSPQELLAKLGSARELAQQQNAHGLHLIVASEPTSKRAPSSRAAARN